MGSLMGAKIMWMNAYPLRNLGWLLGLFVLLAWTGCQPRLLAAGEDVGEASPSTRQQVYAPSIPDMATFEALSRREGDERFAKFVLDLRTGEMIYFDANVYAMHVDFVFAHLYREPLSYERHVHFNRNYEIDKPEFLLGYIVYHGSLGLWTFTFWEGDKLTPAHVLRARERLQETFFAGEQLMFRPDSTLHEALLPALPQEVRVISNDAIYKQLPYAALTRGQAVGALRLVTDADDPWSLRPNEVVIVRATLADLPRVAGIISEASASPLSHVSLRARAWGAPHIHLKGAGEQLKALIGQVVLFEAREDGYTLRAATTEEAKAWEIAQSAPRAVRIPRADLNTQALRSLQDLSLKDLPAFGAKTANLGQLARCGVGGSAGFQVPAGFGVPIHYYQAHMQRHGLAQEVEAILADAALRADPDALSARLAALQQAIRSAPLDPALLTAVTAQADALGDRGLFVRSSTNAEDLPDFNGAGLYDTVPNVRGPALADAIKQVWASTWSFRAFQERALAGIDQSQVFSSVLIQVGVNADAAGVLITRNAFDPADAKSYTINAKRGLGIRVVEGERVAEQLLYNPENDGIKVISRSDDAARLVFDPQGGVQELPNADAGQPVLSDAQVRLLGQAATRLTPCFPYAQPLDIEWLFAPDGLSIVQVRPLLEGHH
jgi:hypothetical protein